MGYGLDLLNNFIKRHPGFRIFIRVDGSEYATVEVWKNTLKREIIWYYDDTLIEDVISNIEEGIWLYD